MRILVVGATGFIGSRVALHLQQQGHEIIGTTRHRAQAFARFPEFAWIVADFNHDFDPYIWQRKLFAIDAVINCAGIYAERDGESFEAVHALGPLALYQACVRLGIKRVVQLTSLGNISKSRSHLLASKRFLETSLETLALDWVVLAHSLIVGEGSPALAELPRDPARLNGKAKVSPLAIEDLCVAVARAVAAPDAQRVRISLAGPETMTLNELLRRVRCSDNLPVKHATTQRSVNARFISRASRNQKSFARQDAKAQRKSTPLLFFFAPLRLGAKNLLKNCKDLTDKRPTSSWLPQGRDSEFLTLLQSEMTATTEGFEDLTGRLPRQAIADAPDERLVLLFDGGCPICVLEMTRLRRLDRRNRLAFVNIAAPNFVAAAYGATREAMMGRMHVLSPGVGLLTGMNALRASYSAVGLGWLLAPTRLPLIRPLTDWLYLGFARHRMRISRWLGLTRVSCDGACDVN